jgi:hypothetical protein
MRRRVIRAFSFLLLLEFLVFRKPRLGLQLLSSRLLGEAKRLEPRVGSVLPHHLLRWQLEQNPGSILGKFHDTTLLTLKQIIFSDSRGRFVLPRMPEYKPLGKKSPLTVPYANAILATFDRNTDPLTQAAVSRRQVKADLSSSTRWKSFSVIQELRTFSHLHHGIERAMH